MLAAGYWTLSGQVEQSISVTVGHRMVTIAGNYKIVTQESKADGMLIKVDGHEIAVNGDQLIIDGNVQVLEPDQNIEIWVDDGGKVSVELAHAGTGATGSASQ